MHNEKEAENLMKLYEEIDTTVQHNRTYPEIPRTNNYNLEEKLVNMKNFKMAVSLFMSDARRLTELSTQSNDYGKTINDLKQSLRMISNILNKM